MARKCLFIPLQAMFHFRLPLAEKWALRYKVWACPIPGVEKGVAFGVRESKRYSIAQ